MQVASFAAGTAVINTVFTQADFIEALAQRAILVAGAASFRLVADHAHEFFGHVRRLSRFRLPGNGPMVDGPAVEGGLLRRKTQVWNTIRSAALESSKKSDD